MAYRGSLDPDHIFYELLAGSPDGHRERLKSRRPFVPAARKFLQDLTELDIHAAQWTDLKWSTEYSECSSDLRAFIPRESTRPMGMGLPRSSWVRLNRFRAGVGCFQSLMHKWGLAPTSNCECGAAEQTAEHIILTCPVHRAPTGIRGLTVLDVDTQCWLSTITASNWFRNSGWFNNSTTLLFRCCFWRGCASLPKEEEEDVDESDLVQRQLQRKSFWWNQKLFERSCFQFLAEEVDLYLCNFPIRHEKL